MDSGILTKENMAVVEERVQAVKSPYAVGYFPSNGHPRVPRDM